MTRLERWYSKSHAALAILSQAFIYSKVSCCRSISILVTVLFTCLPNYAVYERGLILPILDN